MTALRDPAWIRQQFPDLPYARLSPAQTLDLYLPNEGTPPFPLIVAIHGGGFIWGDKREDQVNAPVEAVREGYAVAAINYRLSPEAVFPAPVQDVQAAIRFLRANAAQYGLDPHRFAAWGNSAGGYFAIMAGLAGGAPGPFDDPALGNPTHSSAVQAVIDWFGPVEFHTQDAQLRASGKGPPRHDAAGSPESNFLGLPLADADAALLRRTNPLTYLASTPPPFLIQHGAEDDIVPVQQSLLLADALRAVLPPHALRLDILPGAQHGGPAFETPENMARVFRFLRGALAAARTA